MNELLVDVGQTGTQWRIKRAEGFGRITSDVGLDGSLEILGQVGRVISTALATLSGPTDVFVGVSGLDDMAGFAEALFSVIPGPEVSRVIVAHDSVTSTLGALGNSNGVALAIGTGIVAMGVGPSKAVRVDGWGSVIDDAGSAYWIGRAGIRAALRDADGRGDRTALLPRAVAEFGVVTQISGVIQRSPTRVMDVAGFARVVTELAEGGDVVSLAICDGAVREWLSSARAAAAGSGLPEAGEVSTLLSWSGNVLSNSELLQSRLRAALPVDFLLRPPLGSPLDGASRLADVPTSSPLHALIDDFSPNRKNLT